MCCGIRHRNNWRVLLSVSMATGPLEIVGSVCTIRTHSPDPNLLGLIIFYWRQATSQSMAAAAASALACTPLPWRFCALQKKNKNEMVCISQQARAKAKSIISMAGTGSQLIAERREKDLFCDQCL